MSIFYMCAVAYGGQQRAWDTLELESQAIVSHLRWVLGTKLPSLEEQQVLLNTETSL